MVWQCQRTRRFRDRTSDAMIVGETELSPVPVHKYVMTVCEALSRSELEASALSGALLSNREQVAQRDWRGLMHSIADGNVPASVLEVVVT